MEPVLAIQKNPPLKQRKSKIFLTIDGERKSLIEWSEDLGINYHTLRSRLLFRSRGDIARPARYRAHRFIEMEVRLSSLLTIP